MSRGTRYINGKYYLLAGRSASKENAQAHATYMRQQGWLVRIIRLCAWDYMIYRFPGESM